MIKQVSVFALLIGLSVNFNTLSAQQAADMDSVECLKNFSLYREALKKKMYDYCIEPWRVMFVECPDVSVRLYSDGIDIYKHYISEASDEAVKQAYVDTLLLIYDQRMQYFGNHPKYPEGWVKGRKGIDIVSYRRDNVEWLGKACTCFEQSYNALENKMEPMVAVNWLQATNALVAKEELDPMDLLNVYLNVDAVLAHHISKQTNPQRIAMLRNVSNTCMDVVANSGLGDCEKLESALEDKFLSIKENQDELAQLLALLDKLDCTNGNLYARAAEQNYSLNPSADASYLLAKYFIKQNEFDKAKDYYLKTISQADDEDLQAKCFYDLALLTFSHYKNPSEARKLAKNALVKDTDWGKPYILIGNIYAHESTKYGDSDFEHQTVYWVAIDQYKKAKAIDPNCQDEADKQINLYSQYLPDKETGFFHGIQEGEDYVVGSWINEKTVVRYR